MAENMYYYAYIAVKGSERTKKHKQIIKFVSEILADTDNMTGEAQQGWSRDLPEVQITTKAKPGQVTYP